MGRTDIMAKKCLNKKIRGVPCNRASARNEEEQPPPDLPSFLLKARVVYVSMTLVPQVTELILAQLLYLQYNDASQPVKMYINSTGVPSGVRKQDKLGYEAEAVAVYDTMGYIKPKTHTLAVGSAWGEAALLLSAGDRGYRSALPSACIMIRQPMRRILRMQASDIDTYRRQIRRINEEIVRILSENTRNAERVIANDMLRPKYFTPQEAVEYGLIDKVMASDEAKYKSA